MINYITRATALLALIELDSVAAIRGRNDGKRHGLRELYYSEEGHEVTDVQTKCEQVIEGYPMQCIIVCVEVTSIKNGDALAGEYSRVNQLECEAGWEHDRQGGGDEDVIWEGLTEWPTYSPTAFPTSYPMRWANDGHDANIMWFGDGHNRIVDWTDDGRTSHTGEVIVLGWSKGGKSGGGFFKGSTGGYSKSSKSKGGKGGGQSKSSKGYSHDNVGGDGGSGNSKSSKSSDSGDVGRDRDETIPEPIHDERGTASWSSGAGVIEEDTVSSKSSKPESVGWSSDAGTKVGNGSGPGSSKSSKPTVDSSISWSGHAAGPIKSSKPISESASWSSGVGGSSKSSKQESDSWSSDAGFIKEGNGSVSSKSSKLVADSGEWKSAKWSGSGSGEGSGSSKSSSKPARGSADVPDGKGAISNGGSDGWSGGAAL
jgi:hypothetical protein